MCETKSCCKKLWLKVFPVNSPGFHIVSVYVNKSGFGLPILQTCFELGNTNIEGNLLPGLFTDALLHSSFLLASF